jgi:hypothetical protein
VAVTVTAWSSRDQSRPDQTRAAGQSTGEQGRRTGTHARTKGRAAAGYSTGRAHPRPSPWPCARVHETCPPRGVGGDVRVARAGRARAARRRDTAHALPCPSHGVRSSRARRRTACSCAARGQGRLRAGPVRAASSLPPPKPYVLCGS